jgi:hypothetical protein
MAMLDVPGSRRVVICAPAVMVAVAVLVAKPSFAQTDEIQVYDAGIA